MPSLRVHNRTVETPDRMQAKSRETTIGERITVQADGCWIYGTDAAEYHTVLLPEGRHTAVHRFVYETLVGPIPEGHHLHHACETPGCCNPQHLEPLTPADHFAEHRALHQRALGRA